MSQIFHVCPSFYLMSKNGSFLLFFSTKISRSHKIKTKAQTKHLIHVSLQTTCIPNFMHFASLITEIIQFKKIFQKLQFFNYYEVCILIS